jgi:hypothetical protein
MDTPNQVRLRDIQLVVATVDEHAAAIKHRAHRAIAQHWTKVVVVGDPIRVLL